MRSSAQKTVHYLGIFFFFLKLVFGGGVISYVLMTYLGKGVHGSVAACRCYNPVFRLSTLAFPNILQVYPKTVPSVLEQLHL
jgi:hypothetical protein